MGNIFSCGRDREKFFNVDPLVFSSWPAGNVSEYVDDMIKEVPVNKNESVLVVKSKGKYFAIGSKCTYCNASLAQGILTEGKIITCPWHKASFDLITGDIDDFPGLESLSIYKISKQTDGDLTVFCPKDLKPPSFRHIHKFQNIHRKPTIVIIGAGPAGFMAAETLCQNNFHGHILMLTKDSELPFDKTQLSKDLNPPLFRLELKDSKYYKNCDIQMHFLTEVTHLNLMNKEIYIKGTNAYFAYDKLLIASGSQTPKLSEILEGSNLKNILSLNTYKEALEIFAALKPINKIFVIVGGTFLGLEIATMIAALCSKVIIIGNRAKPLENIIGSSVSSKIIQQIKSSSLFSNVIYIGREQILGFKGNKLKEVTRVVTRHHGNIRCDSVILAMNPRPVSYFLNPSDILININGAIVVDKNMQTSVPDVYAAGDVAVLKQFPENNSMSIPKGEACTCTWNVAVYQGKVAALNMLGITDTDLQTSECVPFFWSKLFGINLRIVGNTKGADEILVYSKTRISHSKGKENISICSLFRLKLRIIGALVTSDTDPLASLIASDLRCQRLNQVNFIPLYITKTFPNKPIQEVPID